MCIRDSKDVEFELVFQVPPAARVRVRSTLLDRLPFGHRQYFALIGANGATLAEKLLSGSNRDVDAALAGAAIGTAPPSHPVSYTHLRLFFGKLDGPHLDPVRLNPFCVGANDRWRSQCGEKQKLPPGDIAKIGVHSSWTMKAA